MKRLIACLLLCLGACADARAAQSPFAGAKLVVFYGDSITSGQQYPALVEAWARTRFPGTTARFRNRGWGGDSASNLARFDRDCAAMAPDVVFINMGMNDARYQPEMAGPLAAFLDSLAGMVERARKGNPRARVHLVSPVVYDRAATGRRAFYAPVLWTYAREERALARRLGVGFIDLARRYGEVMGLADTLFDRRTPRTDAGAAPDIEPPVFSADGIHPNAVGQAVMAVEIVKALGAEADLASVAVDAAARTIAARGASAALAAGPAGEIAFTRTLEALPFGLGPEHDTAALLECVAEDLNRDILTVAGLPGQWYALSADGAALGTFSAAELAAGVNLSSLPSSPDLAQARDVLRAVLAKQALDTQVWQEFQLRGDGVIPRGAALPADDPSFAEHRDLLERTERELAALATPRPRTFRLSPAAAGTDRLKRLERFLSVSIDRVPVAEPPAPGDVPLAWQARNLSGTELFVRTRWSDGPRGADLPPVTLAPGETRAMTAKVPVSAAAARPTLETSYRPTDGSYPAVTEIWDVKLVPTLRIPRARGPVSPDGDLKEWANAALVRIGAEHLLPLVLPRWNGPRDLSMEARLMWDDAHLYMAFSVADDEHDAPYADSSIWRGDSIQMCFLAEGKDAGGKPVKIVYSDGLALPASGPLIHRWQGGADSAEGVRLAVRRTGTTTVYEAAYPWAALAPARPAAGAEYRIAFGANDRDRGGRWKYAAWTHGIWYGNDSRDYARIVLGE